MDGRDELTAELRENLVAYLDGELDEEATHEIEQLLVRSAAARQEISALTRSWDALDVLPRARVSETFTEKTLSTIRVVSAEEPSRPVPLARRLRPLIYPLTWAAMLAAAAVVGFAFAHKWIPTESDTFVENLPMIEELHVYREIGDVKFLRQLQEEGVVQSLNDSATDDDERIRRP